MGRVTGWIAAVAVLVGLGGRVAAQEACSAYPQGATDYTCSCDGTESRAVWGSGPYTLDSDICTAARHAGVIGPEGGDVRAILRPGLDQYLASDQNGVKTNWWGSYDASMELVAAGEAAGVPSQASGMPEAVCGSFLTTPEGVNCYCPTAKIAEAGRVWGSGPYTADSDICWAARHAGVIGLLGGEVSVIPVQGLAAYRGSQRNGMTTADWGSYSASFVFDTNR